MNKLWNLQNYSAETLHRTVRRDGLRSRIHPQVQPFLRREVHTFVRWLRANYPFPIRVNVYIPNTKKIRANDGDLCYGRCFVPDDPDDSITIDVAGGYDYDGDFRALQKYTWGTIFMLAHELGHYYQYLNRVSLTPRGIEWQATYYAHRVQEAYYDAEWDEMDEWAEERADESRRRSLGRDSRRALVLSKGDYVLIAHPAGKSSPIFRAQVAFPLRESADYAIIGLLLKIACFGGNLRKP